MEGHRLNSIAPQGALRHATMATQGGHTMATPWPHHGNTVATPWQHRQAIAIIGTDRLQPKVLLS